MPIQEVTSEVALAVLPGRHAFPEDVQYVLPSDVANTHGYHANLYAFAKESAHCVGSELTAHSVRVYLTGLTNAQIGVLDGLRSAGLRVSVMSYDRDNTTYVKFSVS